MKIVIINWRLQEIKEIKTNEIQYKEDGLYYRWKNKNCCGTQKISYANILAVKIK